MMENLAPTPSQFHIVIAHYRPDTVSGAENSIADFVDQVDRRFQITMLVPGEGSLARFYRQRGFQVWVRKIETPRRLMPGAHTLGSLLLTRQLIKRRVDAVLCNTFFAASRVATACHIAHVPMGIYMRDYLPNLPTQRRMLNRADVLFAISKDVIRYHANMAPVDCFRLTYNYINPEPIWQRGKNHAVSDERLLPFRPEQPVVGLVGRIAPYKQPDLFIRAVPHVLREIPEARFVVVGSAQAADKAYENRIKALPAELGIQDSLVFLGQRKDATELTSELTVACLVSGREPLGRVILEAGLLSVPVIVPDSGGPAEIVQNEVTGLHFSSNAPDAETQLARQIIRLLKDPDRRECLSAKALEHILATFANHRFVEIQEQYIAQLCAKK